MTLRDAVRTSVLSSRWRNLWKDNPIVEFSACNMLEADPAVGPSFRRLTRCEQELILVPRAYRFVHSVNHLLRHRPAVGVKHFIVNFRLLKRHAPYINRWLRFAIESGAKLIRLNLFEATFIPPCNNDGEFYDFPCQLFNSGRGSSSSLEILQLCYCNIRLPEQFTGFASLTELSLDYIPLLSGTDIKNILSTCSNLQKLSVIRCYSLVTLDIFQPSGRLEFLCVKNCLRLKQIEFSGISLQMFYYSGHRVPFIKNAVRIVGLWLHIYLYINYCLTDLPSDFPHLDNLMLSVSGPIEASRIPASYKFAHLKRLDMFLNSSYKNDFITLACILKSAPLVEIFHLNLVCEIMENDLGTKMQPVKYIHKHLKQLKICGFSGAHEEIEFVLDVVQGAIMLEMIILDPYYKFYEEGSERVLRRLASPAELSRERAHKFLNGNVGDTKLVVL